MARLPRYCEIINRYKEQVDVYLNATYGNRRSRGIKNTLCRNLMITLMTGKRPAGKLPDRKLASMLTRLEDQLERDDYRLPKAWYENRVYGTGRGTGASRWQVKPAEIKYLEQLWADLRFGLREYVGVINKAQPAWAFDVDEIHEDVIVWLDGKAIEDIVLVALEAYAVPRQGARFTETYGICFGSIKPMEGKRQAHGRHTTRYIHITSVHIQLRAEGYPNKITYDLRSLDTQMAVATHFFPQLDIVGDFHTHPYKDVKELKSLKGWRYSSSDEAGIPTWVSPLRKMGYHPTTSLIVGIAKGGKRISRPGMLRPNVVRFSIEKYHFYVACFRIIGDKYSDRGISLNSVALPGM